MTIRSSTTFTDGLLIGEYSTLALGIDSSIGAFCLERFLEDPNGTVLTCFRNATPPTRFSTRSEAPLG